MSKLDRAIEWFTEKVEHWNKGVVWMIVTVLSWALVVIVLVPIVWLIKYAVGALQ
jgi:hypothetical protein